MYVVHETLDPSPLNQVNEDNGSRSQLLITLFLKSLEAKKSSTESQISRTSSQYVTWWGTKNKLCSSQGYLYHTLAWEAVSTADYASTDLKKKNQMNRDFWCQKKTTQNLPRGLSEEIDNWLPEMQNWFVSLYIIFKLTSQYTLVSFN